MQAIRARHKFLCLPRSSRAAWATCTRAIWYLCVHIFVHLLASPRQFIVSSVRQKFRYEVPSFHRYLITQAVFTLNMLIDNLMFCKFDEYVCIMCFGNILFLSYFHYQSGFVHYKNPITISVTHATFYSISMFYSSSTWLECNLFIRNNDTVCRRVVSALRRWVEGPLKPNPAFASSLNNWTINKI